jgi:pentatricopeptide repeat protein
LAAPATSTAQPNQAADGSGMRLLATSSQYLIMKDISVLHGSYVIGLCTLAVSSEDPDDREMYLKEAQYELITMEEKNLKPDTATMNAFIQALCAMTPARVTDALLILRAMKIEDIGPDDYTYSILFTALGKEGYIDEALQLFRSTDKVMDTPALNALLRAFIGGPNPLHAVQIYQELVFANSSIIEQSQFLPSKYTFTILYLAISRSISPQKFSTPSQRKSYGYFDDGGREITGKDRRTKLKPMRFLSTLRGATGESYEPVKTASGDVVVDTTIRNVSPPQRALSVLGEVVKSIGVKLNAKKNSQAAASPYSVTGVHGNYVKSTYEEVKPPPQVVEEPEKSLSMAYDESSGRFYESSREKKTKALFDKNIDRTGSTSDLRKVTERQAYTADDLMEDDMNRNPKYDKFGPPDNLDILRGTYFKNQEAKARSASKIPTALKTSGMDAYGEESLRDSKNVDLVNLNADNLLQKLFLSMRFDYNIEADEIMISALNSLFTTTNQFESSRNDASAGASASGSEISDKNDLAAPYNVKNNYKPSTPTAVTLGWAKKSGLSA